MTECKKHPYILVQWSGKLYEKGCPVCEMMELLDTSVERINELKQTVEWMLKDLDFRNEGTGMDQVDSPEVKRAREQLE